MNFDKERIRIDPKSQIRIRIDTKSFRFAALLKSCITLFICAGLQRDGERLSHAERYHPTEDDAGESLAANHLS